MVMRTSITWDRVKMQIWLQEVRAGFWGVLTLLVQGPRFGEQALPWRCSGSGPSGCSLRLGSELFVCSLAKHPATRLENSAQAHLKQKLLGEMANVYWELENKGRT